MYPDKPTFVTFTVGTRVRKITGDYEYEGEIVGVITKRGGQIRFVGHKPECLIARLEALK